MADHDMDDVDDDEGDDPMWTLDMLYVPRDVSDAPNLRTTMRMIDQYKKLWLEPRMQPLTGTLAEYDETFDYSAHVNTGAHVNAHNLFQWAERRFKISIDSFSWEAFETAFQSENIRASNLLRFLILRDPTEDHDVMAKPALMSCLHVLYHVKDLFLYSGRVLNNMDSAMHKYFLPAQYREPGDPEENIHNFVDKKNNSFQNALLELRKILETKSYRRAAKKFFKRVRVHGEDTMAFEECMTVQEFVDKHTSWVANFQLWKWTTDSANNFSYIVKYLEERSLPEAPDMFENRGLRSYEGDEKGRGFGVYCNKSDMFFPYSLQLSWPKMARDVEKARRKFDKEYRCTPPSADSVCVVHLKTLFPYDIYEEVHRLNQVPVGLQWRSAYSFEATRAYVIESDVLAAHLAVHLDPLPEDIVPERGPSVVGRAWIAVPRLSDDGTDLFADTDHELTEGSFVERIRSCKDVYDFCGEPPAGVTEHSFVRLPHDPDSVFVPLVSPPQFPRYRIEEALLQAVHLTRAMLQERAQNNKGRVCIQGKAADGTMRYFRIDTGRHWLECDATPIDHIYKCQKFVPSDVFMLHGLTGRTLYVVGELDGKHMCFIIVGWGGVGKSTIMQGHQSYFQPHQRGIQSPNMQPQFGMAAVCKKMIIYCNEVGPDLKLVQEEWQTAVSGEVGSYAVKHVQDPIVCKILAQHFWVGNSRPTHFKNESRQTSRRLAGVMMRTPVNPRNTEAAQHIQKILGAWERKQVLAYKEFLGVWDTVEPMSNPDLLPPAFRDFYFEGLRESDPVLAMLDNSLYVVKDPNGQLPIPTLKEVYDKYRLDHNLSRAVQWSPTVYHSALVEKNLVVQRMAHPDFGDKEIDVIHGLSLA